MRYARIHASLLLIGAIGCADTVAAPVPDPPSDTPNGWMTAIAEGETWNPFDVSVSRQGDVIVFEGTQWFSDEVTLKIRLHVRADVGLGPQSFGGSSNSSAADVVYSWFGDSRVWTASGTKGSGTVTLGLLTDGRAVGTFSFTASALTAVTNPQTYRVTNGSFDVRF